ncbi:hypothetical protein ACEPAF_3123 [Sanghuangporus sanghuang]
MTFDKQSSSKNGSLGLPSEILVEIFSRCLPTDYVRLSTHPQLLPPFTFTRVCPLWRHLVLSTPRLWSRIVLGRHGTDSSKELLTFEFWLERAGETQPLDIVLDPQIDDALEVLLNEEVNARYERDTTMLIERVCTNSQRWRSLVLDVPGATVLGPLFLTLGTLEPNVLATAPLLEELELTTALLGGPDDTRTLHNIATTCPRLRSLILTCPTLLPSPVSSHGTPVLKNMRILKLRFCTAVSHALDWIGICPNLDYLKVHLLCGISEEDDDPEIDEFDGLDEEIDLDESELDGDGWVVINSRPRVHTNSRARGVESIQDMNVRRVDHLTQLEIVTFSTSTPVGTLLDSLSAPSLRSLKVSSFYARAGLLNTRWLHIPLFLHRSNMPPLEELEINGVPMNIDDMRACLTLTPGLRKLSIGWFQEFDDLLQEMKISDVHSFRSRHGHSGADSTLLCPRLETLNVAEAYFSIDILASMVFSRFALGRRSSPEHCELDVTGLKELRVHKSAKEEIGRHPVIANCVAESLNLIGVEPLLNVRVH